MGSDVAGDLGRRLGCFVGRGVGEFGLTWMSKHVDMWTAWVELGMDGVDKWNRGMDSFSVRTEHYVPKTFSPCVKGSALLLNRLFYLFLLGFPPY